MMNEVAQRLIIFILAFGAAALAFALLAKEAAVSRTRDVVGWLLKTAYFDLVRMAIFLRPLKQYVEQIGIVLWLALAFIIGRYLVMTRPAIEEIPGPYIPFIGYIFFITALFVVWFVLRLVRRGQ